VVTFSFDRGDVVEDSRRYSRCYMDGRMRNEVIGRALCGADADS